MLLSLLIFSPLVFAVAVMLTRGMKAVKVLTLTSCIVSMFLSAALLIPSGSEASSLKATLRDGGTVSNAYDAEIARVRSDYSAVHKATNPDESEVLAWDEAAYARGLKRDMADMEKASGLADQMKFVEFKPWIRSFNVNYFLGADGLSVVLVLLTSFLFLVCMASCWGMDSDMDHGKPKYPGMKAFYILYLLLQVGLIGVFLAQDLMLFYIFWEIVLLPMYFLIGIWGGPNRIYAAIKFFIYTLIGSVLMLIAFLYFYLNTGGHIFGGDVSGTFNIVALMTALPEHFAVAKTAGVLCFLALFVGFAIKVPVVPFHTWLPDAHVQAPTPISMLLAGILLKMGGYGLFRFLYGFMPTQAYDFSTMMAILGAVSIVYGAYCAMGQTDFKRIVAYSSVSHMGYILIGLAAGTKLALGGAALQMIAHGISSPMMFGIVGIIYDRAHHRDVNRFGGIMLQMPYYGGLATVAFFASLGLPGLCGFIPEMMTFFGSFQSRIGEVNGEWWMVFSSVRFWTVISTAGIVLTAVYLLWGMQRVFLGPIKNPEYKKFPDMHPREWAAMVPLGIAALILGIMPSLATNLLDPSMTVVQNQMMLDPRYKAELTEGAPKPAAPAASVEAPVNTAAVVESN
jgi:NADH-quinone oxidoreductase subunit M